MKTTIIIISLFAFSCSTGSGINCEEEQQRINALWDVYEANSGPMGDPVKAEQAYKEWQKRKRVTLFVCE